MDVVFALAGLLIVIAVLACIVFFAIFIAQKVGLVRLSNQDGDSENAIPSLNAKAFTQTLLFRFILIAILVALMNIPTSMVSDVVRERNFLYDSVIGEISETWGERQSLSGPALLVPYTEKVVSVKTVTDKDGVERKENQVNRYQRTAVVLPEDLNINAELVTETRKRSLYTAQVYTVDISLTGSFKRPDLSKLSTNIDQIHWDRAWLSLGITDTQAINHVSGLNWQKADQTLEPIDFEPGTKVVNTISNGFHAPIDLSKDNAGSDYTFSFDINANGSQGFFFAPFGKVTNVTLTSDWPHPSFQGSVLPNQHDISDKGFTATWSIPNLARNYPQLWQLGSNEFDVNEFYAGVSVFEPISLYSKITRAIKYSALFFILTYIVFLIFELGIKRRLHLVQYGVIGLALSLFYLTLLSLAEHIGFYLAYVAAAAIIIVMISLYSFAAIRHFARTGLVTLLLTLLYTLLYRVLKLEDSALLSGTVLLLLILGVLMFMTRNIGRD